MQKLQLVFYSTRFLRFRDQTRMYSRNQNGSGIFSDTGFKSHTVHVYMKRYDLKTQT